MPADRRCLPVDRWPAIDRTLWSERNTRVGLFDKVSAGARWSPRSRDKAERGYGRWLAWLATAGLLDPATPPGERVTRERVAAYLVELTSSCAPYTQVCRIQELYDALRVLAGGSVSGVGWSSFSRRCAAASSRCARSAAGSAPSGSSPSWAES